MDTKLRQTFRIGSPLLLVVALLAVSLGQGVLAAPNRAPARAPQAATLPAETCIYDGLTKIRTCELWAVAGTVDLPGWTDMPIWGYTDTDPALGGVAQLPGPAIIANQGETIQVILHNDLGEITSLIFPGQAMAPDLTGIAAGMDNLLSPYTFVASSPGTYLYEAGPLANAQHQVAMGLFGALVVRPVDGSGVPILNQAYADPASAFTDEALLVLSEIDPALNDSADPAAFDMRDYAPKYFLIDGVAYPNTDVIPSAAGNKVLLRYVNAGIEQHSMGTLGVDQEVLAVDGSPLDYTFNVAAATIGSGQTSDRMVTVPSPAPAGGASYAVYDTSMLLHNNGAAGFGGMLTFITITDGAPPTIGPSTSGVSLSPNPTDGSVDVTLSATISGDFNITGAEYFVDATGAAGAGIPMSAVDGAFGSPTEAVEATITVADLASLASGDHTFYVHGSDGTWGAFNFTVLHLDKLGPATSGITLAPNPSNGGTAVSVSATGNDSASGNSDIAAAEYTIDGACNTIPDCSMDVNVTAPVASLDKAIPAATMLALAEGEHTVAVRSQDAFGWWGPYDTAALKVDQSGPVASAVSVTPNLLYARAAVRVDATLSDPGSSADVLLFPEVNSNILRAEGFINSVGADGTGFPLTPADGLFNSPMEDAYALIPLATINSLPEGDNTFWVHGQDSSGNWGTAVAATLTILPNAIFADGFESGDFSAWGDSMGSASVSGIAARTGMYGMQVNLDSVGYVIDNTPMGEPGYHARFYFDPNSAVSSNNQVLTLLDGHDGVGTSIFRVEYRRRNAQGGSYQVRGVVLTAGGESTTGWVNINDDWNAIEIAWQSANPATFRLYTGGFLRQTVTGLDTSAFRLDSVWLGLSGTPDDNSGTMYFDDFVSTRNTYIGP